jgi:hypothetical protein
MDVRVWWLADIAKLLDPLKLPHDSVSLSLAWWRDDVARGLFGSRRPLPALTTGMRYRS